MSVSDLPSVCVLLSVYNGEKYITAMIESVLAQKGVIPYIYIRDDGSTDTTISLIRNIQKDSKRIFLKQDGDRLGAARSFMTLVYEAPDRFDYYAFADQDDIWEQDKLQAAVFMMQHSESDRKKPILYCSNEKILIDGKVRGYRYNREPNITLVNTLCGNQIAGCTMCFNKQLFLLLKTHKPSAEVLNIRMHDVWTLLVALVCGEVIYDNQAHILYRIHENNTVGIDSMSLRKRVSKLKKIVFDKSFRNGRSKTAAQLYNNFKEIMSEENRKILEEFSFYRNDYRIKKQLLLDKDIKNDCDEKRCIFFIKVLINWI